jgi:hypothetical protein
MYPPHTKKRAFMRFLLLVALLIPISKPLCCQTPHALDLSGDYPITHDPSIAHEGGTYYIFATTSNP